MLLPSTISKIDRANTSAASLAPMSTTPRTIFVAEERKNLALTVPTVKVPKSYDFSYA